MSRRVAILAATAGLQGRWVFTATEPDHGAAIIAIAFRRPGAADIVCRYAAVFVWELLDGLAQRGDFGAVYDASRAAARAIELSYAQRREEIARAQLQDFIGSPVSTAMEPPAGAADLHVQPGQAPVGVAPAGGPSRGAPS